MLGTHDEVPNMKILADHDFLISKLILVKSDAQIGAD